MLWTRYGTDYTDKLARIAEAFAASRSSVP